MILGFGWLSFRGSSSHLTAPARYGPPPISRVIPPYGVQGHGSMDLHVYGSVQTTRRIISVKTADFVEIKQCVYKPLYKL